MGLPSALRWSFARTVMRSRIFEVRRDFSDRKNRGPCLGVVQVVSNAKSVFEIGISRHWPFLLRGVRFRDQRPEVLLSAFLGSYGCDQSGK